MEVAVDLEESDSYLENLDKIMELTKPDFPEDNSPAALRAAEIVNARIRPETRGAHER